MNTLTILPLLFFLIYSTASQDAGNGTRKLTYARDISPLVKEYCLPCHLEEAENPSMLFMDDFAKLSKGGKNGVPFVAGKPKESNFYLKLLPDPPFGKQMPRGKKKKLDEEEVQIIYNWILQGAKEK